jgi:lysophospholipase L1-like esterase
MTTRWRGFGFFLFVCVASAHGACDPKPTPTEPARARSPEAPQAAPGEGQPQTTQPLAHALPPQPHPPATPASIARKSYVIAALGDSITDSRSGGGGYLKQLQAACPQSVILNFGKGGDMTNQMLRRLKADILPMVGQKNIDTLIVYGGVNDLYSDLTAGRTNSVIERDLSTMYMLARAAGLRVVAVTVSPWSGFSKYWNPRRGENTRLLNSWILGQVADGTISQVVDSFALLSCGNPDELCPDYQGRWRDGLHPGPLGHAKLGEKVVQVGFEDCR